MLLLDPAGNRGPASTACSNTTRGLSTMSGVRPVAPPIGCGLIRLQVNVIGSRAGGAAVACLERWLDGVQAQHRDVGAFHGWKPGRSKRRAELCAGKARAQQLLGLPDTDEVEPVLADRAVVPQLTGRPTTLHDHLMGTVVRGSQLLHITTEPSNQHNRTVDIVDIDTGRHALQGTFAPQDSYPGPVDYGNARNAQRLCGLLFGGRTGRYLGVEAIGLNRRGSEQW